MESTDDLNDDRLHFALRLVTRAALGHGDCDAFVDWLRGHGLRFFIDAGLLPEPPAEEWPGTGALLARAFWNELPRPDNAFRPRTLPEPDRETPCPCGSGQPFGQCCAGRSLPALGLSSERLLPYVLEVLNKRDLANLPHAAFPPVLLAGIARAWAARDEADRACALLEPMFGDPSRCTALHVAAFDALMDVYLDQDRPRRRQALLDLALRAEDAAFRGAARRRQVAMLHAAGHREEAWVAFEAARQDNLDDPGLAMLEVGMLRDEDRPQEMHLRARDWARRLMVRPDAEALHETIAMLEDIAADPTEFDELAETQSLSGLAELARLLGNLPRVERPPRLVDLGGGQGVIEDGAEESLHDAWAEASAAGDIEAIDAWLRVHPQAWDSLEILDDLAALLAEEVEPNDWLDRNVLEPLFARVRDLADMALALAGRPLHLDWHYLENRPWHRLMARRAQWLGEQGRDEAAILACEEALACNPDDQLRLREVLAPGYARSGRFEALAALLERYPEGAAAMDYHRALALFCLGHREQALAVLAKASERWPRLLAFLLAEAVAPVPPDPGGRVAGGEYEAWCHRRDVLAVWQATGALDWFRDRLSGLGYGR